MNKKKRFLSAFCSLVLVLTLLVPNQILKVQAAVTLRATAIRDYVLAKEGKSYANGQCLRFVEECYQNLGASRPYDCCAYKSGSNYIQSSDFNAIPIGATVYFGNCGGGPCRSCRSSYYGHVGIYVGNGYFVHATGGRVQRSTMRSWKNKYRGYGYCGNFVLLDDISVKDTSKPVINNVTVKDITADGYTVSCTVTDNVGVDRVQFPTWTENNGQDDIQRNWDTSSVARGTKSGSTYTYRVSISDHNNESGTYCTHIYAFDTSGNLATYVVPNTIIDVSKPTISNVKVTDITANGYTVSCTVTDNVGVDRVQFPTWTESNGQDDIQRNWDTSSAARGTKSGSTYTYKVSISDHNNERGVYCTHIYAFDTSGNMTACVAPDTLIELKSIYYGDVDMNGRVTISDLSAVNRAVVGLITLTEEEKKRADVNGDGKINSIDVSLINRYLLQIIDTFPVEG